MAPTRELALQVHKDISSISQSLSSVCVYGGAPYYHQGKLQFLLKSVKLVRI